MSLAESINRIKNNEPLPIEELTMRLDIPNENVVVEEWNTTFTYVANPVAVMPYVHHLCSCCRIADGTFLYQCRQCTKYLCTRCSYRFPDVGKSICLLCMKTEKPLSFPDCFKESHQCCKDKC